MLELIQTYPIPHKLVEWSLALVLLLSGVIWTSQVRRVARLEAKVKCLAVGMLFLVRSTVASGSSDKANRVDHDMAIRALTDCLKM